MSIILLRNGVALIHGADGHVKSVQTDILIEDNKITKIEENIQTKGPVAEIIDCTNKIISPGFVDTHHHVWQTQLKGRHADETLLEYLPTGNFTSSQFTLSDIFWGQLGGCLEALDAGTTMVVDHAHINYSPEHTRLALSATISSGIRSVFGYTQIMRVEFWNPLRLQDESPVADWVLELMEGLAKEGPWANGRVTLGLSYDLWFMGPEMSNSVSNPQAGHASLPELLNSMDLLDESILFSHASGCNEKEAKLINENNAKISSTPSTELQMAMGRPVCFDERYPELQEQSSLGIDCHSNQAGSIVGEMRLGLQSARNYYNERFLEQGKAPKRLNKKVKEAFNLGTIQGAKAIGMEKEIGSIAVGKLADLVIFDALSPAMVCAAQHDPVAAVVLHSSPADIDVVIVDGVIRKKNGKLVKVIADEGSQDVVGKTELEWGHVTNTLVKTRQEMQKKIDTLDLVEAKEAVVKLYHIDPSLIADEV